MQAGTRLDHYEVVDKLGEGGMGAVYRAEDTRLKRQVAIKVLPPELAADPERLARLEREAQLLASLNHPNVATVHGFGDVHTDVDGQDQRVTFLVMELVEGESLYDRAKMGPMPWREVVEIGIGIAAGLEAAHEQGIVHRDLKPANVHLAQDGTVKVLDFGLAKAFEGEGASGSLELSASPTMAAATRTGVILGTAAYMSPEQARGQVIDKRADIWALGCVLYELLTGRKTFDGGTVSDILASILKETVDLEALPPIPTTLRHVLQRALEKDPARRMRDVADLRLELEAARLDTATTAEGDAGTLGTPWKLVAGVAAVAGAIGLTAGLWMSAAPETVVPETHLIVSTDAISRAINTLSVSPDGQWIAETGNGMIRLRPINELTWREVQFPAGYVMSNAFSADSQQLYLAVSATEGVSLHRLDVNGSSPVLVATLGPGMVQLFRALDGALMISRSESPGYALHRLDPNGTLVEVIAGTRESEIATPRIVLTSQLAPDHWLGGELNNFAPVGLVRLDSSTGDIVSFMPRYRTARHLGDGRLLAVDESGRLVTARIDPATGQLIDPPAVRLTGLHLANIHWPGYAVADDGHLVYRSGENGRTTGQRLAWLLPSGAVEVFSEQVASYNTDTRVAPDGTRIALEVDNEADGTTYGTSVWIHDIPRDLRTELVPGTQTDFPVWSPDGSEIIFHQTGEEAGIYRMPIDRSAPPLLLRPDPEDGFLLPTHWSPDGSTVFYTDSTSATRNTSSARNDLWLLPLDGSEPVTFLATEAAESDAQFSPDGRWVAYQSNPSGRIQIFLRALGGGGEYQVSSTGGIRPKWHPEGGQLFFRSGRTIEVVDVDLTGSVPVVSPARTLAQFPENSRPNLWSPTPEGDRFLIAMFEGENDSTREVRAIFNWSVLRDTQ